MLEALVKRVNQMEKALEAEGKAVPPQEEVLVETDSPIHKDSDSSSASKQTLPSVPQPAKSTNGSTEHHQHLQDPIQQRQQSIGFPEQVIRYLHPPCGRPDSANTGSALIHLLPEILLCWMYISTAFTTSHTTFSTRLQHARDGKVDSSLRL